MRGALVLLLVDSHSWSAVSVIIAFPSSDVGAYGTSLSRMRVSRPIKRDGNFSLVDVDTDPD